MKFLSYSCSIALALAVCLCLPAPADAYCGLQSCPRIDPHAGAHPFEAGLRARVVEFDIAGESGFYGVLSPRFFAKVMGVSLGAEVPWITLHTGNDAASGLGNPLLIAQYGRRVSQDWSVETGLQVELPFGDADQGLADDHTMLLPWVGARLQWGKSFLSGTLGYSQAFAKTEVQDAADTVPSARVAGEGKVVAKAAHNGEDHGTPESPLFVNPHGDRELHWRAGLGFRRSAWTFETFGLGQADVSTSNAVFYTRVGVSAEWAVTSSLALQAVADAPVTAAQRSEAALGVDVKIRW